MQRHLKFETTYYIFSGSFQRMETCRRRTCTLAITLIKDSSNSNRQKYKSKLHFCERCLNVYFLDEILLVHLIPMFWNHYGLQMMTSAHTSWVFKMLLVCSCHCFLSIRDKLSMFSEGEFPKGARSTTVNDLFLDGAVDSHGICVLMADSSIISYIASISF